MRREIIFPVLLWAEGYVSSGFEPFALFLGAIVPCTGKLELISRRMEQKELLRSAPSCLQGRLSLRVRNEIIE